MNTSEWLYARLHHTGHRDGELLLTTIVPQWVAAARRLGAARWFFIRYADAGGPHLRLRFQGDPATMDACWAAGRDLWRGHDHRRTASGEVRRLHPSAENLLPRHGRRHLSLGVYGREHHYYGSPAATEIAEGVFEESSRVALEAVRTTGDDRSARALLAVSFLQACTGALGPQQRDRVWRLHWQHWTSAEAGDPTLLRRTEEQAGRWTRALRSRTPDPVATEPLRRLADRVVDGVHRALAADREAVASRLLLMHMHMTLNRLGFLPLEEALLGRAARETAPAPP